MPALAKEDVEVDNDGSCSNDYSDFDPELNQEWSRINYSIQEADENWESVMPLLMDDKETPKEAIMVTQENKFKADNRAMLRKDKNHFESETVEER